MNSPPATKYDMNAKLVASARICAAALTDEAACSPPTTSTDGGVRGPTGKCASTPTSAIAASPRLKYIARGTCAGVSASAGSAKKPMRVPIPFAVKAMPVAVERSFTGNQQIESSLTRPRMTEPVHALSDCPAEMNQRAAAPSLSDGTHIGTSRITLPKNVSQAPAITVCRMPPGRVFHHWKNEIETR
eukprot:Amastigsp_a1409_72.p3 type:complete len:188 gc:universal Amastigsp_a1409_72:821-258(-)